MKRQGKYLWIVFLLSFSSIAMAQDVIVKSDNSTILSKVIEINSTEIKYKKWNNQDGPTYSILRLEVSSVNYQNGEVEYFSNPTEEQAVINRPQQNQTSFSGYMDDEGTGGKLRINGRVLTDAEVRTLVSPQNYELYLKAKRQNATGTVFYIIGCVSLGVGSSLLLVADKGDYTILAVAGVAAGLSLITLPIGAIISGAGGAKMKRIAKEYNQKNGKYYSYNISPSIMRCEMPQSQGNCGLGLTLSMNF